VSLASLARGRVGVAVAAFLAGAFPVACAGDPPTDPVKPPAAEGIAQLDRCAPVWWQAERIVDFQSCTPEATPGEIAAAGGVVLVGSAWDVSEQRTPYPPAPRCRGPHVHATQGEFIQRIRSGRRPDSPPLAFVHLHRFELVPLTFAALPGFEASFLVRTRQPWSRVVGFFSGDTGPLCRNGGCRWSDAHLGNPEAHRGPKLRDLIDASGGPGAHERVVYYLPRSGPDKRVYWPNSAVADLRSPAYRAWRVAEARKALEIGGYDAILLNDKLGQYRRQDGHWLGGLVHNVEELNREPRTLWSAPPDGYGYPEYVAGWAALGRDLRAAGVPYAVWMGAAAWQGRGLDDSHTADVDEGALVRETVRGARLFLATKAPPPADLEAIERELRARGGNLVLMGRGRRERCPGEDGGGQVSGSARSSSSQPRQR
jgi:hypothetical protein